MQRAFIFANGSMEPVPAIVHTIQAADLVITADGGSHHCQALGITPQVIIGDLDSLNKSTIDAYVQAGVEVIQHPTRKNETDLELALLLALQRGVKEAYILGALGNRWDMTIANVLLAASPKFSTMRIHIPVDSQELFVLRGDEQIEIQGRPGDALSLIPLAGNASGITTEGLEYPLKDETLIFSSPRGVSNVFMHERARIYIKKGLLLCIFNEGAIIL